MKVEPKTYGHETWVVSPVSRNSMKLRWYMEKVTDVLQKSPVNFWFPLLRLYRFLRSSLRLMVLKAISSKHSVGWRHDNIN
jgi:hypothetical protein